MIKAILFDLDGTLLPMERDVFEKAYMGALAAMAAKNGYEPRSFLLSLGKAIAAMAQNDGSRTNGDVFWQTFCKESGKLRETEEPVFQRFYETDYTALKGVCGYTEEAARTVRLLKDRGYCTALATDPMFPAVGIRERLSWSGCEEGDFALLTTIENCHYTKPNPGYYREVAALLSLSPEECLMVGNDVYHDMPAEQVGMGVFLLTAWVENKEGQDYSRYPQGDFSDLLAYIESENAKETAL